MTFVSTYFKSKKENNVLLFYDIPGESKNRFGVIRDFRQLAQDCEIEEDHFKLRRRFQVEGHIEINYNGRSA